MWGQQTNFANDQYATAHILFSLDNHLSIRAQRQLESLYSFFPGQVRVTQVGRQYEVALLVGPSRTMVTITIWLPSDFPQGRPTLSVSPALAHHWVDREMRIIGHGSLAGWNPSFSLGKIIKDVEIEFNLRPPSIVTIPPTSVSASPKNAVAADAEFPEIDSERFAHRTEEFIANLIILAYDNSTCSAQILRNLRNFSCKLWQLKRPFPSRRNLSLEISV